MKEKLLHIIYNHIQTVNIIRYYSDEYYTKNIPQILYYTNTPHGDGIWGIRINIDGQPNVLVNKNTHEFNIPDELLNSELSHIEEKGKTIYLYFTDEPPITIYKTFDSIKQSKPIIIYEKIKKTKNKWFNFFNFKTQKQQENIPINATLSYNERIPIYQIFCGPIKETIDENTFMNILSKMEEKENELKNLTLNNEIEKTKKIIEKRFNQITNHQS